ncbi:hypothetical protein BM526_19720 (plasmid) [Alteromonas mediterranea]|uniref:hypothetical protein n=1 Tax=Alteromonas mediterranea TaxID=314275 RepID=UPI0009031266|nr:hypothetical protein [Alteromonas mediterranea]APE04200.1 hypothetical protein BM526_19720 [Alteromonas mediterranea]
MFSTVDTLTPIIKHFEMSDKSLYLLRPNGSDYVEIKKNAHLGIESNTKALVAFVEDNFPQFKLMPIDERADFAKFIINDDYLESPTHIYIKHKSISQSNQCLYAYLQMTFPEHKVIFYSDIYKPIPDIGGLSISAITDIGIVERKGFKYIYPIKIATSTLLKYEEYSGHSMDGYYRVKSASYNSTPYFGQLRACG